MTILRSTLLIILCIAFSAQNGLAHFGMVIPGTPVVTPANREVLLTLSFSHPFEGVGMDLARPKSFSMVFNETRTELLDTLKPVQVMKHGGWQCRVPIRRPGVYWFVMEPEPYWEGAEDVHIIHYTKTVVAAFGGDRGWDRPVGLVTEIVPLLRPFGNYAGNSFTGKVLFRGKPLADSEVEVELYNSGAEFTPAGDYHVTQVIKTDANGIFTFTCPQPGWWGFAALSEADYTMKGPDGSKKGVELGAVLWVYFDPYGKRQ